MKLFTVTRANEGGDVTIYRINPATVVGIIPCSTDKYNPSAKSIVQSIDDDVYYKVDESPEHVAELWEAAMNDTATTGESK